MLALLAVLAATAPDVDASAALDAHALVQASREKLAQLGTYRVRFTKEERTDDGWVGPQIMSLLVRERPFAVFAEVVAGPNHGRRFLYDATQNEEKLRVREPGLLGVLPLWIDVDSALTRGDTRHPVTELGYGFILETIARDARRAGGRHTIEDEGAHPTAKGERCLMLTAPAGVRGLYAQRTRLCFDAKSLLLTKVDVWDAHGALERLSFELVEANVKGRDQFSLEANGL